MIFIYISITRSCEIFTTETESLTNPEDSFTPSVKCKDIRKCMHYLTKNIIKHNCCNDDFDHMHSIDYDFFEILDKDKNTILRCDNEMSEERYKNIIENFRSGCKVSDQGLNTVSDKDILRSLCPRFLKYYGKTDFNVQDVEDKYFGDTNPGISITNYHQISNLPNKCKDTQTLSGMGTVLGPIIFMALVGLIFFLYRRFKEIRCNNNIQNEESRSLEKGFENLEESRGIEGNDRHEEIDMVWDPELY